jgi:hypothetical protein
MQTTINFLVLRGMKVIDRHITLSFGGSTAPMERYFTNYWTNETWDYNVGRMLNDSERKLRHTASNMFRKRGVSEGDSLYIITVKWGQLLLLCKLTVSDMCGYEEAVRLLENEDLWPAEDHVIAKSPAAIRPTFEVPVPLKITEQLRFQSYPQSKALRFVEPGIVDQQTLRGVRELDCGSAQLLDKFLSAE